MKMAVSERPFVELRKKELFFFWFASKWHFTHIFKETGGVRKWQKKCLLISYKQINERQQHNIWISTSHMHEVWSYEISWIEVEKSNFVYGVSWILEYAPSNFSHIESKMVDLKCLLDNIIRKCWQFSIKNSAPYLFFTFFSSKKKRLIGESDEHEYCRAEF